MKFLIIGYGSIGQRHAANLRKLRPGAELIVADPVATVGSDIGVLYRSTETAVYQARDVTAAIIASPDVHHAVQMAQLSHRRIPFLVEKPACVPSQLSLLDSIIDEVARYNLHCTVGFQYRYHRSMLPLGNYERLKFTAYDDLEKRYGRNVIPVMAAHPFDTALRLLGPARVVNIHSDGLAMRGEIVHRHGISEYDIAMRPGPRVSRIEHDGGLVDLAPDDEAYLRLMADWLAYLETSQPMPGLPTLAEGRAVVEVIGLCRELKA